MPSKKISVILDSEIIRQIEDTNLTQTKAVTEALQYYFSEDREKITEYKNLILSQEKMIIRLEAQLSEMGTLKQELERVHEAHNKHVVQVQTLINDRILRLEDKKKKWYRFW